MFKKQYLINIIETNTEKSYSLCFSKLKGLFLCLFLIVLFFLITLPLSQLFLKATKELKINHLKNENKLLQEKCLSWQTRTDSILLCLNKLKKENKKISILSSNSTSNVQYGVGGPETPPILKNINTPNITKTDLKLSKIENEINFLSESMLDLKSNISSRLHKIAHYPSIKPVRNGWISSTFGKRKDPFTNKIVDHPGLDICTEIGTKVIATGAGKVIAIKKEYIQFKGYGKYVIIDHDFGYKTLYAHLSKIMVKKGQKVNRWDVIGLSGNTGKSTSPHIHYGVYYNGIPQDPYNFILE